MLVANISRIAFVPKLEHDPISWVAVTKIPGKIILFTAKEAKIVNGADVYPFPVRNRVYIVNTSCSASQGY